MLPILLMECGPYGSIPALDDWTWRPLEDLPSPERPWCTRKYTTSLNNKWWRRRGSNPRPIRQRFERQSSHIHHLDRLGAKGLSPKHQVPNSCHIPGT